MTLKESSLREERLWPSAQKIKAGEGSREAHAELVNTIKPVRPYDEPVPPASDKEVHDALSKDKKPSAFLPRSIPKGEPVAVRLDIPAYEQKNTWVVSVHHPKSDFTAGPIIGYDSVAHIDNPRFGVHPTGALNIASGKPKSTIATVHGNWRKTTPEKAYNLARTIHNNPEWRQVGMDPERHSYFYDRETQQPVISADEALHIGPLVYAKNPVYDKPENYKFSNGGDVEGYIPHDNKLRARNLKDFHGKTPKSIRESKWFHGTNKDFSLFKSGESGAIFLTQSPSFAQDYTKQHMEHWHKSYEQPKEYDGIFAEPATKSYKPDVHAPNIMPVHVRAEKPFDYENKKHMAALYETLGPDLISDPYLLKFMDEVHTGDWGAIESSPIQNAIKAMGHDSFFVKEHGVKNLGVYDPSQIKSATGNQGTFDPTNPDITKRDGGDVEYIPHDDPRRQENLNKLLAYSKVRNSEGNHVVLYHITPNNFDTFKAGGDNPELSGPATWLTPHKDKVAAWHNVGHKEHKFKPGTNVMPVYADIRNPLYIDTDEMLDFARQAYAGGSKEFPHYIHPKAQEALVKDGYDGIFFAGSSNETIPYDQVGVGEQPHRDEEIISLHPEKQLKSATGNQGTFDPSNPDITKADGGDVERFHGTDIQGLQKFDPSTSRTAKYHYLADEPETAKAYGQHVYKVKLKPKNMISFHPENIGPKQMKVVHELSERLGENPDHLLHAITSADGSFYGSRGSLQDRVMDELKDMGHDAVRFPDVAPGGGWDMSTVVLDNNIVHAIDKHDPSIGKADGGALTDDNGITAYHGSPHDFDQFDTSQIGTGEGAQAFGHGLYFAESEPVAEGYRNRLSGYHPGSVKIGGEEHPHWSRREVANAFAKLGYDPQTSVFAAHLINEHKGDLDSAVNSLLDFKPVEEGKFGKTEKINGNLLKALMETEPVNYKGHMYEVHIKAHPDHFLDWENPLSEQSQHVKSALAKMGVISNDEQARAYSDAFKHAENNPNTKVQIPEKPHDPYGHEIYTTLRDQLHLAQKSKNVLSFKKSDVDTAQQLSKFGIRGIRYLDAGSRSAGEGSHNYVVFDHNHVAVKRKYEQGGVVG